jgi:hypothetical protein
MLQSIRAPFDRRIPGYYSRSAVVDTSLGVLTLRQQVAALKRKRPRPALNRSTAFWSAPLPTWPRW